MIDYQTFHQIRHLCDEEHLSAAQIAPPNSEARCGRGHKACSRLPKAWLHE
jgi:hypothetical protein